KIQPDGQILVRAVVTGWALTVARYHSDLSPDTTFGAGGVASYSNPDQDVFVGMALEPAPDNRIVALGGPKFGGSVALVRFLATGPAIGLLKANPNRDGSVTLIASNITDGNPGAKVMQVEFYYFDSTGNKVSLGYGASDGMGDWTLTANLP